MTSKTLLQVGREAHITEGWRDRIPLLQQNIGGVIKERLLNWSTYSTIIYLIYWITHNGAILLK
jgi:hypothetical protein